MRKLFILLFALTAVSAAVVSLTGNPASAEQVKCEYCTEEYPCVTVFEFRDVKFVHNVFCEIDSTGREVWNSKDETRFDMFYFEKPNDFDKKNKLDL